MGWYKNVKNLLIKNKIKYLTDVLKPTILESSRTTYFDNLKDYRTESGGPSGELKIRKVPELTGKETTRVVEKNGS